MPNCITCSRYDPTEQTCNVVGGSPIRKCVIAILEEECPAYKGRVLEIGCGGWAYAKRLCEEAGCEWHGVDPMIVDSKGRKSIATKQGTVTNIPYPDGHFDVVLGVQSFEHWPEFDSTYDDGLREIFRVLKPGGLLSLNFPIHFHGHPMFINGDLDAIQSLFPSGDWQVTIEPWRREPDPLPLFKGWRTCGFADEAVCGGTSSWIAQLHAVKRVDAIGDGSTSRAITDARLAKMTAARTPYFYHERLVPSTPRWNARWPEHETRYDWV
ncbi:MAG: class I SAM-dependent methyltransferase, partial [Cytophagaceae bacterium]